MDIPGAGAGSKRHELSPINSEDFDRLWEGFEQQEVKDIFTASEKQGEARPTADEKVGKGGKKSAEPAPPAGPQRAEDQVAQPAEASREDLEGKPQRVFHIVFSHPREDVPGRKNPKDLTRQEFADKLDSVFQDATRDSAAQILKLSVFQELHENEEPHMHAAMQVSEPIRRRTLREKHGIFIHLEDGHRTYWALWRIWRCRPRASRTSTPARGLARAIRPWWISVKERVRKWLAGARRQAGQGAAPVPRAIR